MSFPKLEFSEFSILFTTGPRSHSINAVRLREKLSGVIKKLLRSKDFDFQTRKMGDRFIEFATKVEEETGEIIGDKGKSLLAGTYTRGLTNWSTIVKRTDGTRFDFVLAMWHCLHQFGLTEYAVAVDKAVLGDELSNLLPEHNSFEKIQIIAAAHEESLKDDEDEELRPSFPDWIMLPKSYQNGRDEFEIVKSGFLSVRAANEHCRTAIYGAGGYGKTSLAEEICLNKDIQSIFKGGIYWLQFGMERTDDGTNSEKFVPLEIATDRMLRKQYTEQEVARIDFRQNVTSILSVLEALPEKPVLIISDDIWELGQHRWLSELPGHVSVLVTTRNKQVAFEHAEPLLIDRLPEGLAFNLLTDGMGKLPAEYSERLMSICPSFKGWPLLLKLANSLFKKQQKKGASLEGTIDRYERFLAEKRIIGWEVEGVGIEANKKRRELVGHCIQAGLNAIHSEPEKEFLLSLGVFPDDIDIPFYAVVDLWSKIHESKRGDQECSTERFHSLLDAFDDLSFFRSFDLQRETIAFHDEILSYIRSSLQPKYLSDLHGIFLCAVDEYCEEGWATLSHEHKYGWKHLLYHLNSYGKNDCVDELRINFQWLKNKLLAVGVEELRRSFELYSKVGDVLTIGRALKVSSPVLREFPKALAHQLFGRLGHFSSSKFISTFIKKIEGDVQFFPRIHTAHLSPVSNESHRCLGHTRPLTYLSKSRDETAIVTSSLDGITSVWNCKDGIKLGAISAPDHIKIAEFLGESTSEIVTFGDGYIRYWDIKTKKETKKANYIGVEDNSRVFSTCMFVFSKGAKFLFSCTNERQICVWNVESGEAIYEVIHGQGLVTSATFSDDYKRVAVGDHDGVVSILSTEKFDQPQVVGRTPSCVSCLDFSSDSKRLLAGAHDGLARVWDLETHRLLSTISCHEEGMTSSVFVENDQSILTTSYDGTARIFDVESHQEKEAFIGHSRAVVSAAHISSGKLIATASEDGTLRFWVGRDVTEPSIQACNHDANQLQCFEDDDRWVCELPSSEEISLISTGEFERLRRIISPDSRKIVRFGVEGRLVLETDGIQNTRINLTDFYAMPVHADFSEDSMSLVVMYADGVAVVYDCDDGSELRRLVGDDYHGYFAEFLIGSKYIITASDHNLRFWDFETGHEMWRIDFDDSPNWIGYNHDKIIVVLDGVGPVLISNLFSQQDVCCQTAHLGKGDAALSRFIPLASSAY